MSLKYVENSLSRVDDKTISFKLMNNYASGSATIDGKILLDGIDVTKYTTAKLAGQSITVGENMDIYSEYGDIIEFIISLDKKIERGKHKIEVEMKIKYPIWATLRSEFEGEV